MAARFYFSNRDRSKVLSSRFFAPSLPVVSLLPFLFFRTALKRPGKNINLIDKTGRVFAAGICIFELSRKVKRR